MHAVIILAFVMVAGIAQYNAEQADMCRPTQQDARVAVFGSDLPKPTMQEPSHGWGGWAR